MTRHLDKVQRRYRHRTILWIFLVCAVLAQSVLSRTEVPASEPDFALSCTPVFNDNVEGGIFLVRLDFKNTTEKTLELYTGFFGVEKLSVGFLQGKMFGQRSYPSGGLDNEYHSYPVEAGATYTTFIALNDWLELPLGFSTLCVKFIGRKVPLISSFHLIVKNADSLIRKSEIEDLVRLAAKRKAEGFRTVDLEWILASACRKNEQIKRDIKEIGEKRSLEIGERDFLDSVFSFKNWNAVD